MRTYASRLMLVVYFVVGYNYIALLGRYSGGYTTRNTHYIYLYIHSLDASAGNKTRLRSVLDLHGPTTVAAAGC